MNRGMKRRTKNALSLVVAGVGMGWMIGLSVSPVLQIVVTSVMATVVSIVGALASVHSAPAASRESEPEERPSALAAHSPKPWEVNPLPLAALLIGMVVGSSLGVQARTHEWLAPSPEFLAHRWSGTGLKATKIQERLFDSAFPLDAKQGTKTEEIAAQSHSGVLFSISESDRNMMQSLSPEEMRAFLKTVDDPNIKIILSRCNDAKSLEALRSLLCHSE